MAQHNLRKHLLALAENLSYLYEQNQLNIADKRQKLGLAAVVGAAPACAVGGLKYALPVLGFGLYQLFKSRKNEERAELTAKLHHELNPQYVPKMHFPKPRPW